MGIKNYLIDGMSGTGKTTVAEELERRGYHVKDINEVYRRLDERVARDPTDFGGKPEEKEMVSRLHTTKEDIPKEGIIIDSTEPLGQVVDKILKNIKT